MHYFDTSPCQLLNSPNEQRGALQQMPSVSERPHLSRIQDFCEKKIPEKQEFFPCLFNDFYPPTQAISGQVYSYISCLLPFHSVICGIVPDQSGDSLDTISLWRSNFSPSATKGPSPIA